MEKSARIVIRGSLWLDGIAVKSHLTSQSHTTLLLAAGFEPGVNLHRILGNLIDEQYILWAS